MTDDTTTHAEEVAQLVARLRSLPDFASCGVPRRQRIRADRETTLSDSDRARRPTLAQDVLHVIQARSGSAIMATIDRKGPISFLRENFDPR